MNELILNLKIIGSILIGFCLGLLTLAAIIGMIGFFVFPKDEILAKNINDTYYYTEQTSGWATTSTIHKIKVYEQRDNWWDRELADLSMYYNGEKIDVEIKSSILKVWVNYELKLTHKISDGSVTLNADGRWNE